VSTTRLGDWYGNILQLRRRQFLLFISEHSRLALVMPITDGKHLSTVFPDAVAYALRTVGIDEEDIAAERVEMMQVAFGRTRNRSLLGTLNEFAFMAQGGVWHGRDPESPEELMRFLSGTPILPLKGARPKDLTRNVFGSADKAARVIQFKGRG
jgi:hypothetical protein